jgi:predicted enzyme related to lactoylglutathione lyase
MAPRISSVTSDSTGRPDKRHALLNIHNITFDCHDAGLLASFWAAALSFSLEVRDRSYFVFPDGWKPGDPGPRLLFQKLSEPKETKNRVHLDLRAPDMQQEVERLVSLGARPVRRVAEEAVVWTVMADPEGNEFCVAQLLE